MRMREWSQCLVIVLAMGLCLAAVGQSQDPPAKAPPKKAPERVVPKRPARRSVPPRPTPRKPARKVVEPAKKTTEPVKKVVEPEVKLVEEKPVRMSAAAPSDSLRVALEVESGGKSWGTIIVELNREKAPHTVDNFLRYVDEGFYDGTIFHRVIAGFIVQGGAYSRASRLKTDGLHNPIHCEGKNGLRNRRGTIAMARGSLPHSATSQFFFNLDDTPGLDAGNKRGDEWGYCVFGRVVEGMEIVDRIAGVKTRRNPRETGDLSPSQPIRAPKIKAARRVEAVATPKEGVQEKPLDEAHVDEVPAVKEEEIVEPPAVEEVTPEDIPAEELAPETAPAEKPVPMSPPGD